MKEVVLLIVFAVSTLVGYFLINKVPSLLHTPLMSGMNALSGVTVLGAIASTAAAVAVNIQWVRACFGVLAIALAMINVVGGFGVTNRMLKMISGNKNKKDGKEDE
ncbi:MAG: NAD(P) transhydrogenase subunit alpha [Clostridia bacterium]|nr:NAD(P) transhydrogenase subunit alpha [Clostridia bacterium]